MAQGYYSCSRCGKIHPKGYVCKVGARKKHYRYTYTESKLRSKGVWTEKSKQIREDANYICEVCKDCHKMADAGMIDKEYLKKLARKRIERLK